MDGTRASDRRTQVEAWVQELCRLLEEQITCVREGHLARLEGLTEPANALVAKIAAAAGADPSALDGGRGQVSKRYGELRLALEAETQNVRQALQQVRRVRSAISVYGGAGRSI